MNNRNTPSDEGYQSDPGRPKTRDFTTEELKLFARENKAFREKYFIEEVLTNSANGVIYKGKSFFLINSEKKLTIETYLN